MKFKDYLKEKQPLVYFTFLHSLEKNKIAHAYLIKGEQGSPVLETAKYLAKTLVCDNPDPLACEECLTCMRFDDGNYADFVLIDAEKNNIKVSDLESLTALFQNTASEKKGKMIYIINHIENTNNESLNCILKFLEEPHDNVFAFITTANISKVLPTIVSRCQILSLLPNSPKEVQEEAIAQGVSSDDAEILSYFYNDITSLMNNINDNTYKISKDALVDTLNELAISKQAALFFVEKRLVGVLKTKAQLRLYLDLLSLSVKDMINLNLNLPIVLKSYKSMLESVKDKIDNLDQFYLEVMLSRGNIESNVNTGLLLEHIFISLMKGNK